MVFCVKSKFFIHYYIICVKNLAYYPKTCIFAPMNLEDLKQKAVEAMGFDRLNAMQVKMLETAISGRNILLLSPTGSGKTVAFLAPLLSTQEGGSKQDIKRTLVIAPSRELAQQIGEVARKLGMRIVLCYGGHDARIENQRLASLPDDSSYIIIGTSGRLKDHIERKHIEPSVFTHLILDEYDKSMELGFEEEIKFIVSRLTSRRQTFLTSATHAMPIAPWLNFAPYEQIEGERRKEKGKSDSSVEKNSLPMGQSWSGTLYQVKSPIADKLDTLKDLLLALPDRRPVIIFSGFRESAERIAHFLQDQGMECALYHGGMGQDLRDKAVIRLRSNTVRIMSATDLASRGLDITDVGHVIHYHLPNDEATFTHRNGRTARMGASGNAYFIVGPSEGTLPIPVEGNRYYSDLPYFNLNRSKKTSLPVVEGQGEALTLVYIGRGKKEKISKGDILGFFTKNGGITGEKIGRIDIQEHCSYCAISSDVVNEVLEKVKGLKIKGEKTIYKIVTTN